MLRNMKSWLYTVFTHATSSLILTFAILAIFLSYLFPCFVKALVYTNSVNQYSNLRKVTDNCSFHTCLKQQNTVQDIEVFTLKENTNWYVFNSKTWMSCFVQWIGQRKLTVIWRSVCIVSKKISQPFLKTPTLFVLFINCLPFFQWLSLP